MRKFSSHESRLFLTEAIIVGILIFIILEMFSDLDRLSEILSGFFGLFCFLAIRFAFFLAASDLEERERKLTKKEED